MADEDLHRFVRLCNSQRRVLRIQEIQKYIPYHIDLISSGDIDTRENFYCLQKWYTHALNMSMEQVREHIHQIALSDLEGFTVAPITRPPRSGDDEDNDSDMRDVANIQPVSLELKGYDDAGFYIGEDDDDGDEDMMKEEQDNEATTEDHCSWADEMQDAMAEMAASDSSEWECSDSSSSTNNELKNKPLSDELRRLLLEIGGDPETKRSGMTITPAKAESDDAKNDWDVAMAKVKMRRSQRPGETCAETDLLDEWDTTQGRFYWQTEGLFLCRLTELVYKDNFEKARKVFWTEINLWKVNQRRRGRARPPSSPLKNEVQL
ncbi:hypothetical protein F5B17DRAFT_452363 [Nemania serpens]|nr:hypothetical protein F5B17DRAFT_452363 [Nemania serpens]